MMICPNCGTAVPNDDSFCSNCGMRLHTPEVRVPAVSAPRKPAKRIGAAGVVSIVFALISASYAIGILLVKRLFSEFISSQASKFLLYCVFICAAVSLFLAIVNLLSPSRRNKQSVIALVILAAAVGCAFLFGFDLIRQTSFRSEPPESTLTLGESDPSGTIEYENVRFTLERVGETEYGLTVENNSERDVKFGWAGQTVYAVLTTDRGVYRADLRSLLFSAVRSYEAGTVSLSFEGAEGTPQSLEIHNLLRLTDNGLPDQSNVFQKLRFNIIGKSEDR